MSWFILILVIFGAISGVNQAIEWLDSYYCYPLSYVVVTGNRYFTTNDDLQNLIAQLGVLGTFITQDVNVIQKQIEKLSWIKQVSVRKQWPDTLKIHLVEHIPVTYWNDTLVISTTGIIFTPPKNRINNDHYNTPIPMLYGPTDKAQDILKNYLIFNEILKSSKFEIQSAKMDTCCSWKLSLKNGMNLKLGRNDIIERLLFFIEIYPILLQKTSEQNKRIDYIDFRYRSGVSIKWIYNSIIPAVYNK